MQKLIYFIRKSAVVIVFIILEIIAIRCYAYSTPYTQSRLLVWSNSMVGSITSVFSNVSRFFALREENISLTEHIATLENRIRELEAAQPEPRVVVGNVVKRYNYIPAQVVVASTNRSRNYITINKGANDGVIAKMAVMTPDGYAVGRVVECTDNYAVIETLLSVEFPALACVLAEEGSKGSVKWDGGDSKYVNLTEVEKYVNVQEGNIVRVSPLSQYFPKEAVIGTVERVELDSQGASYNCKVRLGADMKLLSNVVLVHDVARSEMEPLEKYYSNE